VGSGLSGPNRRTDTGGPATDHDYVELILTHRQSVQVMPEAGQHALTVQVAVGG